MSYFGSVFLKDETGTPYGVEHVSNKPRVSSMSYLHDIAEGNVAGHEAWNKFGFTPTITTSLSDVWSAAGNYVPPTAAMGMEVLSSNVADAGSVGFSGTATGGSTTTLIDTGKDFTAGTPVVVGDAVLLDSSHETGIVTSVAETTLTIADGFTHGGSADGATYRVIDKSAGGAGAQVISVHYLDGSFVEKQEFVVLNGTSVVPTTNTDIYRVNEAIVSVVGANGVPSGNISLRHLSDTPVYAYISAGYTRGRNSFFTVPAGKTLFVVLVTFSYGYSTNQTHYARLSLRMTQFEGFRTPTIFYPFGEVVCANTSQSIEFPMPERIPEKTDIKAVGISTFSGVATVAMRGWLETN